MYLSRTVSEIISVKQWRDLEIWVMVIQGHLEMAPLDRLHTSSYWRSIVTVAPSLVSHPRQREILVDKRDFFIAHLSSTPPLGGPSPNAISFGTEKIEWCCYPTVEKV